MLRRISVPFCNTSESTGSEDFPSFVHVIIVLRSLSAKHGRGTVAKSIFGVNSWGGRTLNRSGENIVSWAVSVFDPIIFFVLQRYVPPSVFATLEIFRVPLTTSALSLGKLPNDLDHVILGCGWPLAVQAMVTFCFSSAINLLDDKKILGASKRKHKNLFTLQ